MKYCITDKILTQAALMNFRPVMRYILLAYTLARLTVVFGLDSKYLKFMKINRYIYSIP